MDGLSGLGIFSGLWKSGALVSVLLQSAGSFLLFVPLGALFVWRYRKKHFFWKGAAAALIAGLVLELGQLLAGTGKFGIWSVLFCVLGQMSGAALFMAWRAAGGKKKSVRLALRGLLLFLAVTAACGGIALGAYHLLRLSGGKNIRKNASSVENRMDSRDPSGEERAEEEDEDLIRYDGKAYRYNEEIITVLFMGIDQRSKEIEEQTEVSGESGQADTIFLLVMDEKARKMKVIGISRDTMTAIKIFDYKGNYLGEAVNHLGLAYAFGDGKESSCQYMTDAVSNLFYGIPIHSYVAVNMEAVARINDAVGGVTVTVTEDMKESGMKWAKGEKVTLKGKEALNFIRWRDTSVHHSNEQRMARQKQYIMAFMSQAVQAVAQSPTLPVTLYQSMAKEMVTDIGIDQAVYLMTKAFSMSLSEEDIIMLPGETKEGSVYDEFYADDDALYELILDTFYTETDVKGNGGQ